MPIRKEFQNCRPWILIAICGLVALPSFASNVRLKNGELLKDVDVASADSKHIYLQTAYGKITYPLERVESIDGRPLHAATPAPRATPNATPVAAAPEPLPASTPVAHDPKTAPNATATPAPTPTASKWPPYEHGWNMELLLLGFAAGSAIWLATVARVQRDLYERREDPGFWSNIAIVLPGLGTGIYFVVRNIGDWIERRKAPQAPRTANEVVADRAHANIYRPQRKGFEFLDEDRKAVLVKNTGTLSGIESAQDVLEEALLERASDVHIEPAELEYRVRFRIDGVMQSRMTFERNDGQRIVSALKTLAQIDVAEKRKAQDGRFRVRHGNDDIDFRVATANSIFGEKIVIRILNRKMGLLGLKDLGMSQMMMEQFTRVIHSRSGMILATGPTGSGKTSTLYSALSQIDAKRMNVVTIEDPVEYELAGATQMLVNVKAGVTYESGLRSLLRQDPDVILVGEMRDIEAAQIALRAALTGHLLFTSLHTKDAIGTLIRLEEMGIERNQLASALLVIVAQRLVRVLCPVCRQPHECTGEELREIGIELPAGGTIYKPKGCPACRDTGYTGRTGIFEMIVFDEDLREAVTNGADERTLAELARTKGHRSYRADGAEKLLLGITSVEEVLQAN